MSLNDNFKILGKKTTKMETTKTNKNKNRKALLTYDQKKTTVMMVALVKVVVSVALQLAKQRLLKVEVALLVEMLARAGVVVLIVVENSWGQGEIC